MKKSDLHKRAAKKEQTVMEATEEELQDTETNEVAQEDTSTVAFLWLLVFSVLMFTFPFLTFYAVYSWLKESFNFTIFQINCFAVLAAVIVVNAIICLYVYKAFNEGQRRALKPVVAKRPQKISK